MKMKTENANHLLLFSLICAVNLSLSTFYLFGYEGWKFSLFFTVNFIVAVLIRENIWGNEFLSFPDKLKDFFDNPKWLFFFGKSSTDQEWINTKIQSLRNLHRRSSVIWLRTGVIVWFIVWGYIFIEKFEESLTIYYFPLATITYLLLSSYLSVQLLFSLGVSLLLTALCVIKLEPDQIWILLPQLVLTLMSLTVYRRFSRMTNSPELRLRAVAGGAALVVAFIFLSWSVIKPRESKLSAQRTNSIKEKLKNKIAEQIVKSNSLQNRQTPSSPANYKKSFPSSSEVRVPPLAKGISKNKVKHSSKEGIAHGNEGRGTRSNSEGFSGQHSSKVSGEGFGNGGRGTRSSSEDLSGQHSVKVSGEGFGNGGRGTRSSSEDLNGQHSGKKSVSSGIENHGIGISPKDFNDQHLGKEGKASGIENRGFRNISESLSGQTIRLSKNEKRKIHFKDLKRRVKKYEEFQKRQYGKLDPSSPELNRLRGDLNRAQAEHERQKLGLEGQQGQGGSDGSGDEELSKGNLETLPGSHQADGELYSDWKENGLGEGFLDSGKDQLEADEPDRYRVQKALRSDAEMIKNDKRLRKKKIEEVKLKIDKVFRGLWMVLKVGIFILLIFAVVKTYGYLKKRDPEAAEEISKGLDEKEKYLLRQKYETLKNQKLSAEEEVIATYNFFLQTMYLIEYPKENWRTVSDYQIKVSSEFNSLEACSQVITDAFCDTWYGKKAVQDKELIRLREARDQLISRVS